MSLYKYATNAIEKYLENQRLTAVLRKVRGKLLDVGCGTNTLVRRYRNGIGMDVFSWEGVDVIYDGKKFPFRDEEFDTVSFVACFNHIVDRAGTLREAYRVLKKNGRVIITCINPVIGYLCHKVIWWDSDQTVRGMSKGEKYGMTIEEITTHLKQAGFCNIKRASFLYGLNNIYIADKYEAE